MWGLFIANGCTVQRCATLCNLRRCAPPMRASTTGRRRRIPIYPGVWLRLSVSHSRPLLTSSRDFDFRDGDLGASGWPDCRSGENGLALPGNQHLLKSIGGPLYWGGAVGCRCSEKSTYLGIPQPAANLWGRASLVGMRRQQEAAARRKYQLAQGRATFWRIPSSYCV